jgi:hypothetical protein
MASPGWPMMPRYFLHLHNDIDVPDYEGVELADLEAARDYARFNARQMMAEILKDEGSINLSHSIDIEDGHGTILATVVFSEAVFVEG